MADGSIRIDTKLETKPTEADLKKLEKECEKTGREIEKVGEKIKTVFTGASKGQLNSAFKTANKELEKTEAALSAVEDKIKAIQAETDKMLPEAATDEQAANLLKIEESETAPLLKQRDELAAKAAEYKRQMEGITAELNKQAQAEAAQSALKTGAKDAVADAEWMGKIKSEQEYNAILEQTQAKMAIIEQEAARIAQLTGVPVNHLLEQNSQYQTLARRAQLLTANQASFKGKVSESTKETRRLGDTMTRAFDKGLKRISRMAVGILGARSAFMALRRAANTYMEANEDLKYQVEGLWNVLAVAIGPVVQQLVSWLTIAISYVNAFVKALWGVDLVAKANAMALKKQEKATAKAAEAQKKANAQLAGFDEMNKLNDTSTSSADSAEVATGTGQFEAVPINSDFLNGIIDNLGKILPLVTGIAAGIAAWKIASFFGATLSDCLGWALLVAGAVVMIGGACDAWINGLDWGNFFMILAGGAAVVGGLALVFGPMGAAIGAVVAGVTAIIVGIKDLITDGPNLTNIILIAIGAITAITAAVWLLNGSLQACPIVWIIDVIVALIAIIALCIIYWEDITAAIKHCWEKIVEWFGGIAEWFGEIFRKAWEAIKTAWSAVGDFFANIWDGLKNGAVKAWDGIKNVFSNVGSFFKNTFKNAWEGVKNVFSTGGKIFDGIKDGIVSAFKTVVNGIITGINKVVKVPFEGLNKILDKIQKLKIAGVKPFNFLSWRADIPQIPKLAKGGIVNNPGRGVPVIAGEAGAEAVLPLENNTGWMDILAEKINGGAARIVVPIYLNGRKIAEEIIDLTKQRNFATNGAF